MVDLIIINVTLEIRATLKSDLCSARECFKLLHLDGRFLFNRFQGLCDSVLMIRKRVWYSPMGRKHPLQSHLKNRCFEIVLKNNSEGIHVL